MTDHEQQQQANSTTPAEMPATLFELNALQLQHQQIFHSPDRGRIFLRTWFVY